MVIANYSHTIHSQFTENFQLHVHVYIAMGKIHKIVWLIFSLVGYVRPAGIEAITANIKTTSYSLHSM